MITGNERWRLASTQRVFYKADELAVDLETVYKSIGTMAKAVASLLFGPAVKIDSLTPVQVRILQAIRNCAIAWAENAGFAEVAEDIRKRYRFTNGVQKHIDELTLKRNRSYDHGR